ncbi:hypothetical protein LOZ58_001598 [Ophidiomyces ophidiicola]|nr:hypothetical protein LOZ66_001122 [Ophidiomyces ophidiicola]KAI1964907.1 hypothetical protein LOZ58_001598 [Ophidiomyces ophidiicola]
MEPNLDLKRRSTWEQIFHVEYVILYRFSEGDQADAIHQFKRLVKALNSVGLETSVRPATNGTLFVFLKAVESQLDKAVHRGRVRDWLYGVRQIQPHADEEESEDITEAERLRTVYHMITASRSDGGAGITPKHGEWKHVEAVFPLHDKEVNKEWILNWSRKTLLSRHDLDQIRAKLGERVAFYFAFLQTYFTFLMFPAAFGTACWVLLGQFSIVFALVNSLACLVFVEFWKRQEVDLKLRWNVKGVSAIKSKRRQFKHEKEVVDSVTGEKILVFPAKTRLARQLLQVPFALAAVLALGTLIAFCFAIEIFIAEIYSGPFKTYLAFIPTIILSLMVPTISGILTTIATQLTEYENYECQDSYDVALTQKIFVLNFITSYLPIFLTAFVYVPFAQSIVPYLDIFNLTTRPFLSGDTDAKAATAKAEFQIDRTRLRGQVIYFAVTAQIVNFGLETVLPFVKRKVLNKYTEMQEEKKQNQSAASSPVANQIEDCPAEAEFLARVRKESELSEYDVTTDLREMCVQFGYMALFSPVWPLVPVSFLINNWVELRSDFIKICNECKRPVPLRSDTIGPWLDSLGFLAWLGSITSAALVYMFSDGEKGPDGTPSQITGWLLLLTIFFSEHLYLLARLGVQIFFSKIDSPETRHERAQRYMVRKAYLGTILPENDASPDGTEGNEKVEEVAAEHVTREALEEDARRSCQQSANPTEMFWKHQRGWKKAALAGVGIIQAGYTAPPPEKKKQ